MSPFLVIGGLALAAMLLGQKKRYRVLFEVNGAYQTPNGERTELDADKSSLVRYLEPQLAAFDANSALSWSTPDTLQLLTTHDGYFKDQLIPVNEGQLVVRGVSEVV